MSDMCSILIDPVTRKISFGFPRRGPVQLTGIFALVQLAAYTILRRIEGDQFRGDYGTKFLYLPGTATINDIAELRAEVAIIIKDSERLILAEQKTLVDLAPSEQLVSLTMQQLTQDNIDPTTINIYVKVVNALKETFTVGIPNVR